MPQARYIMVGGFLGAGKTTALLRLAEHLTAQGLRVGLITNDQSVGLVDTRLLGSHGFPVEEITGGCFCCRFNSLIDAAQALSAETKPDVFLAEPVGSCTDLKASVSYPLRRLYGDGFRVAPLSVLVDPTRALRVLGLEPGKTFSPKVLYVYEKQLEEAEIIVINKCDSVAPERLAVLREALCTRFPAAEVLTVSARNGTNLTSWFERLQQQEQGSSETMALDYALYAEGEALLGWLNATLTLDAEAPVEGNALLQRLAHGIQGRLGEGGCEIAHLKMTLSPDEQMGDIAVLNLTRNEHTAELSHRLHEPVETGELILNLRAEGEPELLREVVLAAIADAAVPLRLKHMEQFRPAKPVPTYRMQTSDEPVARVVSA